MCSQGGWKVPSISALWAGLIVLPILLAAIWTFTTLSGTPTTGLLLGAILALVLYRHWRWAAVRPRLPRRLPHPRSRRGFSLLSAITSLAILSALTAISVQVIFTTTRARRASLARAQALAAAVSTIEQVKSGALSASSLMPTLGVSVRLRWQPGPLPSTSTLHAQATVAGQQVTVSTIIARRPPGAAARGWRR